MESRKSFPSRFGADPSEFPGGPFGRGQIESFHRHKCARINLLDGTAKLSFAHFQFLGFALPIDGQILLSHFQKLLKADGAAWINLAGGPVRPINLAAQIDDHINAAIIFENRFCNHQHLPLWLSKCHSAGGRNPSGSMFSWDGGLLNGPSLISSHSLLIINPQLLLLRS